MQRLITVMAILAISTVLGEENKIEILTVEECFDSASTNDATMDWSITEEGNDKLLSFVFEAKELVDMKELKSEISVYRPGNDGEYELILTTEGSLCNYVTKSLGDEWQRVRNSVDPPLEKDCIIPQGYYVTVLNISKCQESDVELGELEGRLTKKPVFDQTFTGELMLPVDLDMDAVLQYKASIWDDDDEEWEMLYTGDRSVCRSLVKSLPYQNLADETSFPNDCPIKEGTYNLKAYPVSGESVVFNTIRGVNPLVKHRLRLLQDELLILCRVIYTVSHE